MMASPNQPLTKQINIIPKLHQKKYKASELPLNSATRSAIDGLAQNFKKKGGYDDIRKEAWEKLEASVRAILLATP